MSSVSTLRWRGAPLEAIAWREWSSEFVVRNERTGSTHLLGSLAGRVLRVLLDAEAALSVDEIAARLAGPDVAAGEPGRYDAINAVLSEFRRLGLAEPAEP